MAFNVSPFLTTMIASPLLGEKITLTQVVSLAVAFCGICLMILCGEHQERSSEYTPSPIMYIVLLMLPVCASVGSIASRKVKNLNQNVISVYMVLSLFVIFLPVSLAQGLDLGLWFKFSITDFFFLIVVSAGTILSHTLRFMAI